MANDTIMGTKKNWKNTALGVMLREACACKRDAPKCVGIRVWPVRRDDSSRVLIGAAGMWRSDWPARVQAFGVSARSDR